AVDEVEVAHEGVERGRPVRRGAEEHGVVAEELAEPRVVDGARGTVGEALAQQPGQPREAAQDRRGQGPVGSLERRVEEVVEREAVRLARVGRVRREARARAGLDRVEPRTVHAGARRELERRRRGVAVGLEEHAVGGVERHEVEVVLDARAEQREEVLEDLGHEVPGRAGVEAEAVDLERARAAAHDVVALQQRDARPPAREQRGGGEPGDPSSDDGDARCPHASTFRGRGERADATCPRSWPPAARAASATFTVSGTRTRARRMSSGGVAARRARSRSYTATVAATAMRGRTGRPGSAARAAARSASTSRQNASTSRRRSRPGTTPGRYARPSSSWSVRRSRRKLIFWNAAPSARAPRTSTGSGTRSGSPGRRRALRKTARHMRPTTSAEPYTYRS